MKVAILTAMSTQRGGGELMLTELLRHSPDADLQWTVIFLEDGPLVSDYRQLGIDTQVLNAGRLRHLYRFGRTVYQVADLVRERQIDLLLSWSAKPHLYGSLAGLITGVPTAWYQLGHPVGRHRSLLDRIATLFPAAGIITLSQTAQDAQRQMWPHRPTHLVYPSVQLDRFDPECLPSPEAARRQLGLPTEGPVIGMVGRLQRWKGMHVLIEAIPSIQASRPDAHFVIVGGAHDSEPTYGRELRERIQALGVSANITLAGFQQNVPLWMQAMDLFVHASDHEPFGIVIIEAMALGKPVVAGDAAGPREIIDDGQTGLLAPFEDVGRLSTAICRYLDSPSFAKQTAQAAQQRAQAFSPERYARNLTRTLHKLTASRACPA